MVIAPPDDATAPVALVRWPSGRLERQRLAREGVPCLLLIEPGAVPPDDWGADEDWIRSPADPFDLHQRVAALRHAATSPVVHLDECGVLRRGDRWVALGEVEAALVAALLERSGKLVRREALHDAAWPAGGVEARALDRAMARVRAKVDALGIEVHCVTGVGHLLHVGSDRALDGRPGCTARRG